MGKLRDSFTFANVVSVLALLFALGLGTAWAAGGLGKNVVRSSNIAKGQVKTSDLASNSVTSLKVADGTLLMSDFAPSQLPKLPNFETQKVVAFSANADVDSHNVTATCPSGKKAVGGGGGWAIADSDPANQFLLERSEPTDGLDGWNVTARRISGVGAWVLRADAVCMYVSP